MKMKPWIKATIVAILALFSTSCSININDDDDDVYYLFEGKTWSRIEERPGYAFFVCYDFYRDGTYEYWYYENDIHTPVAFCIQSGSWGTYSHGNGDDIKLWSNGHTDVYDVNEFLEGLCDHNSYNIIDDYKREIDHLYHSY